MDTKEEHPLEPEVYQRNEFIIDESRDDSLKLLRFMTWNVLANGYRPSFPTVPDCYFVEEYRYNLMIQEIKANAIEINGTMTLPQIICLQEINMGDELIKMLNGLDLEGFQSINYKYDFIINNLSEEFGNYILYNSSQYKLLSSKKDFFRGVFGDNKNDRTYIIVLLEHLESSKKICICTTHLDPYPDNQKLRVLQATEFVNKISEFLTECQEQELITKIECMKLPIIAGGDYNYPSIVDCMLDSDISNGIEFKSAYLVDGKHPEFTTFKYKKDKSLKKELLDFIFYNQSILNDSFKLKSIREAVEESDMVEGIGNPCHKNASDHFSLAATFEF